MDHRVETSMDRRTVLRLALLGGAASALPLGTVGCATPDAATVPEGAAAVASWPIEQGQRVALADGRQIVLQPLLGRIDLLDANGAPRGTLASGLQHPVAAASTADGALLVVEHQGPRVARLDASGGSIGSLDGGGALRAPRDLALAGGELFVADALAHQVLVLDASGAITRAIGAFGVDAASLNGPRSVAIDPRGRVLVADGGNRRVQVYSPAGEHLDTWRTPDLVAPRCVRVLGDTVLVADSVAGLVHAFDLAGRPLAPIRPMDAAGRAAAPVWLSTADGALVLTVRPAAPA